MPGMADPAGPLVRASLLHSNLKALSLLGVDVEREVRARLRPETLAAIEGSARVTWLPLSHDIELSTGVYDVAGPERMFAFGRDALLDSIEGPLLEPILDGAIRLFGLTPARFFKLAPRVWPQLYRGAGELRVEEAREGELRIVHEGAPPEMTSGVAIPLGIAGSLSAVLAVTRVTGTVEVEHTEPGRVVYLARYA